MSRGTESAVPVLNDPQFGLTAILRPYVGFDAQGGAIGTYQGQIGFTPLMFTEGGNAYDPQAATSGYSKALIKGLAIPFGARIVVWLPSQTLFFRPGGAGPVAFVSYTWQFIWRQRNVRDYRTQRIPFHYPKQGVGALDTSPADQPPERVIIPAACHSVVLNAANPVVVTPSLPVATNDAIAQIFSERFQPTNAIGMQTRPLSPPPASFIAGGVIAQGLADPNLLAYTVLPIFQTVEVQALGDELLVACTKDTSDVWDFTDPGQDLMFSYIFGTVIQPNTAGLTGGPFVDIGVYVNIGVAT